MKRMLSARPSLRALTLALLGLPVLGAARPGAAASTSKADVGQPVAPLGGDGPTEGKKSDADKLKLALVGIDALGLSAGIATSLEGLLHKSFGTIDTVAMIPAVDVQIARQDQRESEAPCEGGPACRLQLGQLLGADMVVYGTITGVGEVVSLNLRAMDVAKGEETGREAATISQRQLIPEMRLAAYRLIAPDRIRGKLLIDVQTAGVSVEVDGQFRGVTPLAAPLSDLVVGEHTVRLTLSGYAPVERKLTVKAFETARLKLEMSTGDDRR